MSWRSKHRLATALLLLLMAYGVFGACFAVARATEVTVSASDSQPGRPHKVFQQPAPAVAARPIHRNFPLHELRPPDILILGELFQRPPPAILLARA